MAELHRFLSEAGLDAIGVFGYSDEDGTEAATLDGQLDPAEIARRVDDLAGLADELMAQRAADRVGEMVEVLLEEDLGGGRYLGRAAHQAPEVDGTTTVLGGAGHGHRRDRPRPGHRRRRGGPGGRRARPHPGRCLGVRARIEPARRRHQRRNAAAAGRAAGCRPARPAC